MYSNQRSLFSRDEWRDRGRIVTAPNEEARDVVNYFSANVRGARHVFAQDQTQPVEEFRQEGAAA
jgi:hypothetical protein